MQVGRKVEIGKCEVEVGRYKKPITVCTSLAVISAYPLLKQRFDSWKCQVLSTS